MNKNPMVQRICYLWYLGNWYVSHSGRAYKGMAPSCFEEFLQYEYLEMKVNSKKEEGE